MSEQPGPDTPRGSSVTPRRIAALVVVVVLVAFLLQNSADTTVRLLVFEFTMPLWLVALIAFVLGGVMAWLLQGRRRRGD